MHIHWHHKPPTPSDLLPDALPLLLPHEAMNNILLSMLTGVRPPRPLDFLLTVHDDHSTLRYLAGQHTGRSLTLSYTPHAEDPFRDAAFGALLANPNWSAIVADKASAHALADLRAAQLGTSVQIHPALGVYACTHLHPAPTMEGHQRLATEADLPLLLNWFLDFSNDINEPSNEAEARDILLPALALCRPHLWISSEGTPVSTASWAGPTPTGIRINFVYTPPEHRGHGYASANVAALTRKLFAQGRKVVFLFTDLANPTSNKIYQRLGFSQVGESAHISIKGPGA